MGRPRRASFERKCAACGTPVTSASVACPLCYHTEFKALVGPDTKDSMHDSVENLFRAIRRLRPRMVEQYTEGDCYQLGLAMTALFPAAQLWYDQIDGHVVVEIGGGLYDITGLRWWVERHPDHVVPWSEVEEHVRLSAPDWKWRAD